MLKREHRGPREWLETGSSKFISIQSAKDAKLYDRSFAGLLSCTLLNGDKCTLDSWVVARQRRNSLSVARVVEILQLIGSESEFSRQPDLILLSLYNTGPLAETYRLPILIESRNFALSPYKVS